MLAEINASTLLPHRLHWQETKLARPGDNNPRAFGDAVSLDAWRTPFNGTTGEADLHVNVVFSDGRIGGIDSPVRFRLQILRAEVHVIRDAARILDFKRSSVLTGRSTTPARTITESLETEAVAKAGVSLETIPKASAEASRKVMLRRQVESKDMGDTIKFVAMKTAEGYMFRCDPTEEDALSGSPWPYDEKFLTLIDTGRARSKGEPPELRVELRCRREDLHIYDLEVISKGRGTIGVSADKALVLNQYIKDELFNNGFMVSDVSEPFSEIILADVTPREE